MKMSVYILLGLYFLSQCTSEKKAKSSDSSTKPVVEAKLIHLKNSSISLKINSYGGSFVGIELNQNPVNPLTWKLSSAQMPPNNQKGAPFEGHFLCLGRWGSPSEGEIKAGLPHNGEATNTLWKIIQETESTVQMENEAPMDYIQVQREVKLAETEPTFLVKEKFIYEGTIGRINNVVQHITLGPPFLNPQMLVNSNAQEGFNQKFSYPNPHALEETWPYAKIDSLGNTVDLRKSDIAENYVSTHIFGDQAFGWVCAYDPLSKQVLGYVWKTEEYPWINIWNHFEEGKPFAKGLEFGTTGIGRSYQELLTVDTRFHGLNSFAFMDVGETWEKTFQGFMLELPNDINMPIIEIDEQNIKIYNLNKEEEKVLLRQLENQLSN